VHRCGETGDHQRLLGDDACDGRRRSGKEYGSRDVAEAKVFLECESNGALNVGNGGLDHRLGSEHGPQLLFAAGEHGVIPA